MSLNQLVNPLVPLDIIVNDITVEGSIDISDIVVDNLTVTTSLDCKGETMLDETIISDTLKYPVLSTNVGDFLTLTNVDGTAAWQTHVIPGPTTDAEFNTLKLDAATNQIHLNNTIHPTIITAPTSTSSQTITIPDTGITSASFILTHAAAVGGQTITTGLTVTPSLSTSELILPDTSSSSTGVVVLAGATFLHTYPGLGSNNIFMGQFSGNFSSTSDDNICIGKGTGFALTEGFNNIAVGTSALEAAQSAYFNVAIGESAGAQITTGNSNVCIGNGAGVEYVGDESNNIVIGADNLGTAGENAQIRIGLQGTQLTCNIAGIYGNTPSGTSQIVYVDTDGTMSASTEEQSVDLIYSGQLQSSGASNQMVFQTAGVGPHPVTINVVNPAQTETISLLDLGTTTGNFIMSSSSTATQVMSGTLTSDIFNATTRLRTPAVLFTTNSTTALSAYVQGTFTPDLLFGGTTSGSTFSVKTGSYTRIGNRVMFEVNFIITSLGAATGVASFNGLPYAATNTTLSSASVIAQGITFTTGYITVVAQVGGNVNTPLLQMNAPVASGNNVTSLSNTNFSSGASLYISGTYSTTASP